MTFGLSSILTSPLTGSSKQHQFTQVTWGDQSSLRFLPLSYYTISCSYWVTPTGSGVPYVGDSHSAVMDKDGDGGGRDKWRDWKWVVERTLCWTSPPASAQWGTLGNVLPEDFRSAQLGARLPSASGLQGPFQGSRLESSFLSLPVSS